jgi:hypothetical protein
MGRRKNSITGGINLSRLRRRAALGYWIEVLARAAAPSAGIVAAYLIAVLFGFANPWACAGVLLLALAALGLGVSRLRRPDRDSLDRRIERASGLRHRPLATLEDEPENAGPLTAAIWQLHQLRVAGSLHNASSGRVFVDAVGRDPFGLRGLLLLLLLAAGIIAGPQAIPRIAGAFAFPEWPFAGPSINAWITPPAYTGEPPLVLQPGQTYPVLAGSRLTVVVGGEDHPPAFIMGAKSLAMGALAQNSFRADTVLTASARLTIGPWWHPLARWNFSVSMPAGPVITLKKPFIVNRQLNLSWNASDRYGLETISAMLSPVGYAKALPEVIPLPIAGADPRHPGGVAKPDIGDSPFAGLPVSLLLKARNLAGVEGSSAPVTLTLPPPELHDKTAMTLAALRQQLALTPARKQGIGDALMGLAQHPLSKVTGSTDVQMAALAEALKNDQIGVSEAGALLNSLKHQVELGPDYQPSRALAAAAQALEQALQQAANGGKPLDANRLQNLLAAMQSALAQHLQALGPKNSAPADAAAINAGDLNRLAQQIAQDEAAGQTAKAQAELHQLEQMLSALQSAKPMSAADAARATAAKQAAQALAKITQGESTVMDQTNQGIATPASQAAVQNALDSARRQLGKAGIALPGLGDAAAAMRAAQTALARPDMSAALAAENSAIQGLQKAAAALAASSQGFDFDAGGHAGATSDSPENGGSGAPDENPIPTLLPSAGSAAGMIQQQIIKNDSNPALPAATHQYYQRLLNSDGP